MIEWFVEGGNAMWVLLCVSIVSWAFILERFFVLQMESRSSAKTRALLDAHPLTPENIAKASEGQKSALSRVLSAVCENAKLGREDNLILAKSIAGHEILHLQRGLTVLEVSAGISPLLGLLGTVLGMVQIFGSIGQSGLGDPLLLSSGISTALNTTVFGLVIAIPCSAAFSFCESRVETLARQIEKYAALSLAAVHAGNRG